MKKLVIASLFVASVGSVAAMAEDFSAYVSDEHCGATHHEVSDKNTKCVTTCLKGEGKPVLVVGDKVYKVDADSVAKVKALAGQNVMVKGSQADGTITVESIEAK